MIKTLEIDTKTCGKWLPKYILGILRKYPQTNFQEWSWFNTSYKRTKKVGLIWYVNFGILMLIRGRVMCDWTIGNQSYTQRWKHCKARTKSWYTTSKYKNLEHNGQDNLCDYTHQLKVILLKTIFNKMTTYYDTIPIYVTHNDLQWDISELINNQYPIQNDNWEISDLGVLFLKENSSFDHDYDPWNRKMRSWQYLM